MEKTLLNEFKELKTNRNYTHQDLSSMSPTQILLLVCRKNLDFRKIEGLKRIDETAEAENEILKNLNIKKTNRNVISFIFHELIGNIYDHSKFNNAFVMGKEYDNFHEIGFIDDGITIQKSLNDAGYTFESEAEYIVQAINGLSTKNVIGYIERGSGLNNTINITVNGGDGEVLIASGKALVYIKKDKIYTQELKSGLNGTLVSIKINLKSKIDIYNFLKHIAIN